MGQPVTLHSFYAGMARDMSRDQMPPGFLWNLQDYIPNKLGAPLRKRGGWTYASSAVTSGNNSIADVIYTPIQQFQTGNYLLAIDSASSTSAGPSVWSVDETTGALTFIASVSAGSAGVSSPSSNGFKLGRSVVLKGTVITPLITAQSGQAWAIPTTYDGNQFVKCAGLSTEPGYHYATIYKDRCVLGNAPNNRRRLRFSAAGSPDDFTDTTSWIQIPNFITGLCGVPNALMIFSADECYRIRGSSPPPGSDMVLDKLSDTGCIDHRSTATWQGKAIYANLLGVYMTDGFNTSSLTDAGFMSYYYRTLLANWTSSWELNAGVYRDYYFLSISNAPGGTFQDCLVCDLPKRAWFRFQNFNFRAFAEADESSQKMYVGMADAARVANIGDCFNPTAANKADADGDNVLPVVEYPATRGYRQLRRKWVTNEGLSRWKRAYITYDLRDAGSDDPTLTMSYVTTPDSASYTSMVPTLTETTAQKRAARSYGPAGERGGKIVQSMAFKIAQTGPSSDTRIYTLQGEYEALEESRLAQ